MGLVLGKMYQPIRFPKNGHNSLILEIWEIDNKLKSFIFNEKLWSSNFTNKSDFISDNDTLQKWEWFRMVIFFCPMVPFATGLTKNKIKSEEEFSQTKWEPQIKILYIYSCSL